jgi:hypothetical protein
MPQKSASAQPHDPKSKKDSELQNEGEGSRSAARRYDTAAEHAAKDVEQVQKLAQAAEKALSGAEGKRLREAEEHAKRGPHDKKAGS